MIKVKKNKKIGFIKKSKIYPVLKKNISFRKNRKIHMSNPAKFSFEPNIILL